MPKEPILDTSDTQQRERWIRGPHTKEWKRQFLLDHIGDALLRNDGRLDDLAAVVAAGTLFEFYVRELIGQKADLTLLEPENVEPLPFTTLVRMARSLAVLPETLQRPLVKFARLRNRFAHDVTYRLSDSDVKELQTALNAGQLAELEAFHLHARTQNSLPNIAGIYVRCYVAWLGDEIENVAEHDGSERV